MAGSLRQMPHRGQLLVASIPPDPDYAPAAALGFPHSLSPHAPHPALGLAPRMAAIATLP